MAEGENSFEPGELEASYVMVNKAPTTLLDDSDLVVSIKVPKGTWYSDFCIIGDSDYVAAIDGGGAHKVVMIMDRSGHLVNPHVGQLMVHARLWNPWLLAALRGGKLAVYDKKDSHIKVVTAEGGYVRSFPVSEGSMDCMMSNAYGHLVTTHHNRDSKYITIRNDENGFVIRRVDIASEGPVYGNTLRATGGFNDDLVISDSMHQWVRGYSVTGEVTFHLGLVGQTGQHQGVRLSSPQGVYADGDRDLYIADHGNDCVLKVDILQGHCTRVVRQVSKPLKVLFDSEKNLYVLTPSAINIYLRVSLDN